jgi:hypothetical protein
MKADFSPFYLLARSARFAGFLRGRNSLKGREKGKKIPMKRSKKKRKMNNVE